MSAYETCICDLSSDDVASDLDTLPVCEGIARDRLADAAQKAAVDLIDQLRPLLVVEDFAHQNSRLGKIVVIGTLRIGAAHHFAVGLPAVRHRSRLVRPVPPHNRKSVV